MNHNHRSSAPFWWRGKCIPPYDSLNKAIVYFKGRTFKCQGEIRICIDRADLSLNRGDVDRQEWQQRKGFSGDKTLSIRCYLDIEKKSISHCVRITRFTSHPTGAEWAPVRNQRVNESWRFCYLFPAHVTVIAAEPLFQQLSPLLAACGVWNTFQADKGYYNGSAECCSRGAERVAVHVCV